MSDITIKARRLKGQVTPPADKSISHRAVIIASLASGKTRVNNLSLCEDCLSTLEAFRQMGISITRSGNNCYILGKGLRGLRRPVSELYLGNSGTSMRLLLGVLAGQDFSCVLSGDASLSRRPMKRITHPLSLMGARIKAKDKHGFAPLTIQGGKVKAISYKMPIASAQLKSAVLLAGLYARGRTKVVEPVKSRDHTERMLRQFGVKVLTEGREISVQGPARLKSSEIYVPGDISAASFFLVGAAVCRDSRVRIKSVGLNPTRTALLDILREMGADVKWNYQKPEMASEDYNGEPKGQIYAEYSRLKAVSIKPAQIASLIDELPILMVAATQAEGRSEIRGAAELRVKETDRIKAMVCNLSRMGAKIESRRDDVIIHGPSKLKGCIVESYNDHRIAMSMAIAAMVSTGQTTIRNADCVRISFPGFFNILSRMSK